MQGKASSRARSADNERGAQNALIEVVKEAAQEPAENRAADADRAEARPDLMPRNVGLPPPPFGREPPGLRPGGFVIPQQLQRRPIVLAAAFRTAHPLARQPAQVVPAVKARGVEVHRLVAVPMHELNVPAIAL